MKKTLAFLTVGFVLLAARADYSIYWGWKDELPATFSYATLVATLNGTSENLKITSGGEDDIYFGFEKAGEGMFADLSVFAPEDLKDVIFQAFLWDEGDQQLAKSTEIGYTKIGENHFYSDMGTKFDNTPYLFSTAAVPEPTSGMLFLLGLAGLALRRKRVVDGSGSCTKEM